MTDTRITVDVSTEALLQRARQQQAQSRQAVIQQEEEKRERARQQREAQKAGRGSVPGQSRLQGRSRAPQTGSKRREVAAGYVQQVQMATAYLLQTDSYWDGVGESPERLTYQIWNGNQSAYVTWTSPTLPLGSYYTSRAFQALPINKNTMIVVGIARFFDYFNTETAPACFLVSPSVVRQVQSPATLIQSFNKLFKDPDEEGNVIKQRHAGLRVEFPTLDGYPTYEWSDFSNLLDVGDAVGTPSVLHRMLGIEQDKPPGYYKFTINSQTGRYSVTKHLSDAYTGGQSMPLIRPLVKLSADKNRDFYTYTETGPPGFQVQIATTSCMALAWDWGNPALCRRLLLQLGFTPADLVP